MIFHCLFAKLKAEAQELNVLALSSVVMGKEVEAETISLYRRLESESPY